MKKTIISEELIFELRTAFCCEAIDHLESLERLLLAKEETNVRQEAGRLLHSLKGSSHSADFGDFGLIVHELEDLLVLCKSIERRFVDFLLRVVDRLREAILCFQCGNLQESFQALKETSLFVLCFRNRFMRNI